MSRCRDHHLGFDNLLSHPLIDNVLYSSDWFVWERKDPKQQTGEERIV